MSKTLEDLFFGEIQPNITYYEDNQQLKECTQIVDKNEEMLLNLLEGREKKLFIDLMNAQNEIDGISACENFINGFKLGAKIIAESIYDI